jgi:hypothetical protein
MEGVPGLELPKVGYGYQDPHALAGLDVAIVGVGNGAAEAAMRFFHAGARVTVLNRGASIDPLKWRWHLGDLVELVRAGAIRVMHRAKLARVEPARIIVETASSPGGSVALPNDRVVLILGYEPSTELFGRLGIAYDPSTLVPRVDPRTLESSVLGVYLAGMVLAGRAPDRVFIHGSRHHGKSILAHITGSSPLPVEDRGIDTIDHWKQFESFEDELDPELALELVPAVIGEHRDNLLDVHVYRALVTGRALTDSQEPAASLLDAMEGWRFRPEPDGAGTLHGRRLSAAALDIVRRADGTRRIRDIVDELAAELDQPAEEIRGMVIPMFLSLLRSGTLAWLPARLGDAATGSPVG